VREIHSYVVRVYRRDGEATAGLVEDVATGRTAPFQALHDLCELVSGRRPFPRRRASDQVGEGPASKPAA
jgi:hypothetical protein